MAQVLSAFHIHPWSSTWRTLFDSLFPFYFNLFLLSVPVFLFHLELFLELHYTIVMANLRCSAAEESEDTLNSFTSHTLDESSAQSFEHTCKSEVHTDSAPCSLGNMSRGFTVCRVFFSIHSHRPVESVLFVNSILLTSAQSLCSSTYPQRLQTYAVDTRGRLPSEHFVCPTKLSPCSLAHTGCPQFTRHSPRLGSQQDSA